MQKQLKTTRVLIIDAALMILFAVVLVGANISLTNHVSQNLKLIDDTREQKLSLILQMRHIVLQRSELMLKMYVEHDAWQIDEDLIRFYKIALKFIQLKDDFLKQKLTDTENEIFSRSLSLIKITEPLQNDIVERIQSGDLQSVHNDISKKDIPIEIELLGVYDLLTKRVVVSAHEARIEAKDQFTRALILVSIVSVAILLGIIFLMNRSLRKIQQIEMGLIIEAESQGWDATHDPLTNIYNRRWLKYKIESLLHQDGNKSGSHVLIYMDLDDFKVINDKFGHVAGDQYLQLLCRKVENCIRQNDTFARMGGDEFAVLLENCGLDTGEKITNDILSNISKLEIKHEGSKLGASSSIGVCQFTGGELTFDELIHKADALCYRAKKKGKNRIAIE